MRVGVIARGDDRGLGNQTWEVCRHLRPDKVLLVDMVDSRFRFHPERFSEYATTVVRLDRITHDDGRALTTGFLAGLDVVYSAETFYDHELPGLAAEMGVATVLHANPEFFKGPEPTAYWLPTSWCLDRIRDATTRPVRVMPMPVPTDRWPSPGRSLRANDEVLSIYHPGGHPAMGDRNGTRVFLAALRRVRQPVEATVITQANRLPAAHARSNVRYRRILGGVADYWTAPLGHHVAVIPRRYGGLCLPAHEAAGAGLGLVMTDCAPNHEWPAVLCAATPGGTLSCSLGDLDTFDADAARLAAIIDAIAADPSATRALQRQAIEWADAHAWHRLGPVWIEALREVAGVAR